MIKNYKHIIWDWNGTLFNDVELCVNIMNGLLRKRNINQLTIDDYKNIFTFPVSDYYAKVGFDFSVESFEKVGKEWMDEYEARKSESTLHPGARDILEKISKLGKGQSILSAYSQHTLVEIVEHYNLTPYFSHLVGLDHIYATSKVELGLNLIRRLELKEEEAVLIGDTVHDYDVAKEIGADCILIANGHQCRNTLLKCGTKVLNDINEIFID